MESEVKKWKQQILDSIKSGVKLIIVGGNSKDFFGREIDGERLETRNYSGIINYEPTELFIRVKAGTPLFHLNKILAEQGQMLAFEPAQINSRTTIGGVVASGLSGPRRPYTGSVRDYILGVRCLNGLGKEMSFGGQVMKNVAGYDLSRLMTGALGTLGVILDVSIKVVPIPETELTVRISLSKNDAIKKMNKLSSQPFPLSAACYDGKSLYLRLSGKKKAVYSACKQWSFEEYAAGNQWWQKLRDYQSPVFKHNKPLWRLSVPSACLFEFNSDEYLIDWGGAQYWLTSEMPARELFDLAKSVGGSATLFHGRNRNEEVFQPLSKEMHSLHVGVKDAFDPHRILNPGRMYVAI